MKLDSRVVAEFQQKYEGCNRVNEQPHIAAYGGVPCAECGSRRTERIGPTRRRLCQNCGLRGEVRVTKDGCAVVPVP